MCDVHPPSKADTDSFRVKPAPYRLAEEGGKIKSEEIQLVALLNIEVESYEGVGR